MADVVVVGAGLGGLATAARLAKRGHRVTVYERASRPGGAMVRIERGGFGWDAGPASTALPAVLRDLFRTSGRTLDRYVDLTHRAVARRHLFTDGSIVDLPTGSRAAQIDAVEAGLGAGTGLRWAAFVDAQADVWTTLRTEVLDVPEGGARLGDRRIVKALRSRTSLAKLLQAAFDDSRLRQMVSHHVEVLGSSPRDAPAYTAVQVYVERSFGVWQASGGMAAVTDALITRLAERGVTVNCDCPVAAIDVAGGRATGVVLASGDRVSADAVVTDIDPRIVVTELVPPGTAGRAATAFAAATPALPPSITHLGLAGARTDLPDEVVLHGDPMMVLTTTGSAPPGHQAWTLLTRGGSGEDPLAVLAARGLDVRALVVERVDRSPSDIVAESGSSYGHAWGGWRAAARRAAYRRPLPGLFLVGASAHPGPTVPYVGWGAANTAHSVDAELVTPTRR